METADEITLTDWSVLSDDKIEFVLSEAQIYLRHLAERHTEVLNRIQLLFTFYFAAIALLLGSGINEANRYSGFLFTIFVVLLLLALVAVRRLLLPEKYQGEGSRPSDMLIDNYVSEDLFRMKLGFLVELQRRIEICRFRNQQLYAEYKRMLELTCAALVSVTILFCLGWTIAPLVFAGLR